MPASEEQPIDDRLLAQAIASAESGRTRLAQDLLVRLVRASPDHEQAWLWLASLASQPRQRRQCLRQVLRINPRNAQAIRLLRQLDQRRVPRAPANLQRGALSHVHSTLFRRWLGIWLLVAGLLVIIGGFATQAWVTDNPSRLPWALSLVATPTPSPSPTVTATPTPTVPDRVAALVPRLEEAWDGRDWQTAAGLLTDISALDPNYPGLDAARCDNYLHWAGDLAAQGQVREAYNTYHRAVALCDDPAVAEQGKSLALEYLLGQYRYDRQRWADAAAALQRVYDVDPGYNDAEVLLYQSYIESSKSLLVEGELEQARAAAASALGVQPGSQQAQTLHDEIRALITPTPAPDPANPLRKRIEVNISEQRMYVWEGDTLLYDWVCSTGEPGRGTAPGNYRVLDKIPEAWASTWSLRMPYWLGIYYAGSLENGIHALPILSNGQILWAGYLGTPVSYGCVILSTENARTLYNWADVGTPVWIHY